MAEIVNTPDAGNASEVEKPVDNTPEHLQGKSHAEVLDMYQNLERKLGEQSEELGSLRRLADQALTSEPSAPKAETEKPDFWSDPEGYIDRIVDSRMGPVQSQASKQREEAVAQRLTQEIPNWREILGNPDFQQWVADDKTRKDLFLEADASADFDKAAFLFSTYAALDKGKAETQQAADKAVERDRKLRAATTEKVSGGIDPRKILSRLDLQELRQKNPDRYNQLLPDIKKAYAEGRVR